MENEKHHFIYKTTNLINGSYYIGMHSTFDIEDSYIGSGQILRYAIKKYGIENFKREILEFFISSYSLKLREKEIINEDLLKDPKCMNLAEGGQGGNLSRFRSGKRRPCNLSEETKREILILDLSKNL